MTTQSAIIVQEPGRATLAENVLIPELPDKYILVKTKAGIFPFSTLIFHEHLA
jgi:hypothetical protein